MANLQYVLPWFVVSLCVSSLVSAELSSREAALAWAIKTLDSWSPTPTAAHLAALPRAASTATGDDAKWWVRAIQAEAHWQTSRTPLTALADLVPVLVDPSVRPDVPAMLRSKPLRIPAITAWTIDDTTAPAVVEVARALAASGDLDNAGALLARQGQLGSAYGMTLASEGAGDIAVASATWLEALTAFDAALSAVPGLADPSSGMLAPAYQALEARIRAKRDWAGRQRDLEQYGPAFIAYREAERERRERGREAIAAARYRLLRSDAPKTVFAEAAQCYEIMCLLRLSWPDGAERLRAQAKAWETTPDEHGQPKDPRIADHLNRLPTGSQAAKEALAMAAAALTADRFGLYRGEILLALADDAALGRFDPQAADTAYRLTWEWLSQVGDTLPAHALPGAEVPELPPTVALVRSDDGEISRSIIPLGALLNRQTCPWYLDALRDRCASALALIAFHAGDQASARTWVTTAEQLPSYVDVGADARFGSLPRLRWGIEHGCLFAYPEELALFTERTHFAVILADYAHVSRADIRARELAERILAGQAGRLTAKQADYVRYLLATAAISLDGKDRAFPLFEAVTARRDGTLSEDRARFVMGQIARFTIDGGIFLRGHLALRELAHAPYSNDFVWRAKVEYGWRLLGTAADAEGVALLTSVPDTAGTYHALAQRVLHEHRTNSSVAPLERQP